MERASTVMTITCGFLLFIRSLHCFGSGCFFFSRRANVIVCVRSSPEQSSSTPLFGISNAPGLIFLSSGAQSNPP